MTVADETVAELLAQSLAAWSSGGEVERAGPGVFLIGTVPRAIRIERASSGLPFRWMVTVAGRRRGAASLVGVLRQLRQAIQPDYAGIRLRIALAPMVPQ